MCDCITEIEKKLKEHFDEEVKIEDYERPEMEGKTLVLKGSSNSMVLQMSTNAVAKYQRGKQHKKWERYIYFTFCPFCGEKYPD